MAETGQDIARAAGLLRRGELVAIPTETVYGLAANGLDARAVLGIFEAKQRPHFDPLILHIAGPERLSALVTEVPAAAERLMEAFWPGPLTLLLPKRDCVPDLVTSGLPRVAVRVPSHSMTRALLEQLDFPLAAPSANPFGYVSPTTAAHVDAQLGDRVAYILDGGACDIGLESTIIGFEGEQAIVHRLGGLRLEDIEAVLGEPLAQALNQNDNPAAPGMISSHYAPLKPLVLGSPSLLCARFAGQPLAVIAAASPHAHPDIVAQVVLAEDGRLETAAQRLFSALRQMDASTAALIVAEPVSDTGLGRAINDRLQRAAVSSAVLLDAGTGSP